MPASARKKKHFVQIYQVGEHGGWAYFALEFVPGGSLARQLAGRPQPATQSARLVEAVAQAMAYAHERGVVHRDLKPANILFFEGCTPHRDLHSFPTRRSSD